MKQYSLGPNGGILTSLNLFATRFDQVLALLDKRSESYKLSWQGRKTILTGRT